MTTVKTIEAIGRFLQDSVCSAIKLKKPGTVEQSTFELVTPRVFKAGMLLEEQLLSRMTSITPCLLVGFDEAADDGQDASINIRIVAGVYNPGLQLPGGTAPDDGSMPYEEGWYDLANFLDLALAEIQKTQVLNCVTVQYPIKWGVYRQPEQQTSEIYPYYFGWITFTAKKQSYPRARIVQDYL